MGPAHIVLIIGLLVYIGGLGWLLYMNLSLKYNDYSDRGKQTNRVIWATVLTLIGLVVFAFAGIMAVTSM